MSNETPAAVSKIPNMEAEELAVKHNISVEEAEAVIDEQGHDRGAKDFAAQKKNRKSERENRGCEEDPSRGMGYVCRIRHMMPSNLPDTNETFHSLSPVHHATSVKAALRSGLDRISGGGTMKSISFRHPPKTCTFS